MSSRIKIKTPLVTAQSFRINFRAASILLSFPRWPLGPGRNGLQWGLMDSHWVSWLSPVLTISSRESLGHHAGFSYYALGPMTLCLVTWSQDCVSSHFLAFRLRSIIKLSLLAPIPALLGTLVLSFLPCPQTLWSARECFLAFSTLVTQGPVRLHSGSWPWPGS